MAPSPTSFDVDVGPTASGHAYVVYSRCEDRSTPVPKGCEIYAYDMRTGREHRYDASSPTESEAHPTYWAGRLVFVRYYGRLVFVRYHGPDDDPRPVVYMRRARSSGTSQRLPGLPARRCLERNGCGSVTGTVDTLELYGSRLGQTASTVTHTRFDRRLTEVRLVDVKSGRSEQIASRGRGESGQEFIGPSLRIGRLYTYFTCHGDTGGCIHGIGGAYR